MVSACLAPATSPLALNPALALLYSVLVAWIIANMASSCKDLMLTCLMFQLRITPFLHLQQLGSCLQIRGPALLVGSS